tara:strand:+ start:206 stop:652 length:447 start_codon:yes stop_codon:yes gene_type:complete
MSLEIQIVNKSNNPIPKYESNQAAGLDLRANLPQGPIVFEPGQRKLIPTGLHIALPDGFEAQVRPRSGLAYKHGITVLNTPGTIDADYRGDIGVILINHGQEAFEVNSGDRIAQLIITRYERVVLSKTDALNETRRGVKGFGSTGKSN